MSDITKGYTFTETEQVTAAKLHSLASGTIATTAITDQSATSDLQSADSFLIYDASASTLKKTTLSALPSQTGLVASTDEAIIKLTAGDIKRTVATNLMNVNALTTETVVDSINDFVLMYDTSATDIRKVAPSNFITVASQAQMEAGTSISTYVTPGRTQYYPGVAKAWVSFNGTGVVAVNPASLNITSITDNGTGDYTINFTTSFSAANYSVCFGGKVDNSGGSAEGSIIIEIQRASGAIAVGSCRILTGTAGVGLVDFSYVTATFFGDQ